ncbi:MAG: hypothetical protein ACRD0Z_13375 [Acidimicrobiales bacterium]
MTEVLTAAELQAGCLHPRRSLTPVGTQPRREPESEHVVHDCSGALLSFASCPGGIALTRDGALWVSDPQSGAISRLGVGGTLDTVVRPRVARDGRRNAPAPATPVGLAEAPDGSVYVADRSGHRIWAIWADGSARVVTGGAQGSRDGSTAEAMFRYPADVAFASDGTCYVADTANDRIRLVSPDGVVTTLAGASYGYRDGRGADARFRRPSALDVASDGACYVADTGNNAVRLVTPDGSVTTLAGIPPGGDRDGTGEQIGLRWPTGIAAGAGGVFVADHGNGVVRHVDTSGTSRTWLRLDGLRWPVSVALKSRGTLFVSGTTASGADGAAACLLAVERP